jgi:hypothetical protein
VPPVPTTVPLLVEETTVPPAETIPPPEPEEKPVYTLSEADDRTDEIARRLERQQVARWLARAEIDLARRREPPWRLEKTCAECLLYPLRSWLWVLGLAASWATLIAALTALPAEGWLAAEMAAAFPLLVIVFLLLGFTFAWLRHTLAAGVEGRAGFDFRPAEVARQMARCGVEAVLSFLAGPVVFAAVAFFFWLDSGDFDFVDCVILWELGLAAVGYWALALMAMWEGERFRDANPLAVVRLVQAEGRRVPAAALLMALVVVSHGLVAVAAVETLHHNVGGWFLLIGCWAGQLFWLLFLLRWLGVSRFRALKARQRAAEAAEAAQPLPTVLPAPARDRQPS